MNIGVLGGTFDPVHIGHLTLAEEVAARLNLAEVLFIPAGRPWLKADVPVSATEHRVRMVRLAIAGRSRFRLRTMEIERAGPSYSVDTIRELKQQIAAGDELFFILGWDNLIDLPRWRQPSQLIKMCRLVTVPRIGYPVPDLAPLEAAIPGLSDRLTMLDKPEIDISASGIRERVRRGLSIEHLVPEVVEKYIKEQGLYKVKGEGGPARHPGS
jgi:nicotinate-nucleotide adenylyltransferase